MDEETEARAPIAIGIDEISPAALRGVVEEFVGREGTDYGAVERSFEEKIEDVMRQLQDGEARIVFDPETESVTLLPAEE